MGVCASSQHTRNNYEYGRSLSSWPHTAKIVHIDGSLQELNHSVGARHILSQNPNSFLCSWETMDVDQQAPQVGSEEELQLGQVYFLIPLSQSTRQLSLHDLCALAVKASTALSHSVKLGMRCRVVPNGLDVLKTSQPFSGA
ncbi:hypothetical protein FNV43_RR22727 [Rhamnella rubrinervis]|uniref:Uncharacterized protein n=1 Tax=Rhamnella rubrinervis TaxID=2594499 RepID=A0A8K0DS24_9ROSA|nr:hypothetical protein FNV43_RR22727 [Rhamnella rubrinervis]